MNKTQQISFAHISHNHILKSILLLIGAHLYPQIGSVAKGGCIASAWPWISAFLNNIDAPPLNQHFPLLRWKHFGPFGKTWPQQHLSPWGHGTPAIVSLSSALTEVWISHTILKPITRCFFCVNGKHLQLLGRQDVVMRILACPRLSLISLLPSFHESYTPLWNMSSNRTHCRVADSLY